MTPAVLTGVPLAGDPALPRRDDLLDSRFVGARLEQLAEAAGGRAVLSCTRVRARYRRGESLRTTYRVDDGQGTRLVSARMFTAGKAPAKLAQARAGRPGPSTAPGSVLVDEVLDTVFWVFPADRKLSGLHELVSPPATVRGVFDEPWTRSELLAYTPEKAATVRCQGASGSTVGFAKVQVGDEGRRSVALLEAARRGLPEDGPLHLPRAVAYLPDRHLALFSEAPGVPLHQLPRTRVPDAMAALGAALSVLHAQPTDGFAPFTRLDPDRVRTAGELVTFARPDLAPLVGKLLDALLSAPPASQRPVLLHGDLHPKNVLVHEAGISLVDLDLAGKGAPAAELGGTLARLWCPRPGDPITRDTADAAAEALLAAYTPLPERGVLRWYAAAALLVERAGRAVSRVDLATLGELERVLTTALHWAATGEEDRA
jgi:aminoglycoside phosphotransferase